MLREVRTAGPATVTAAEGDGAALARFEGNAYTGAVMEPDGWWGGIICDLDGIRVPKDQRPVLRQHDHEKIVGHADRVTVDAEGIKIAGVLSNPDSEHAREIVRLARNGFAWQLSIGATPVRTEFLEAGETATVNGREVTGPLSISRETELGEISFVPLGADGDTSVTVTASRRSRVNKIKAALAQIAAGKYTAEEIDKMDEAAAKAALKECMDDGETKAADDKDMDAADDDMDDADKKKTEAGKKSNLTGAATLIAEQRKALAAENRRVAAVTAAAKGHPEIAAKAVEDGWSVEKTEGEVAKEELKRVRAERPGAGVGGPLVYSTTTPEATEAVLEAAVLHAMRHALRLEDDSFFVDATPDGKGTVRRVPVHLQRDVQRDFRARYTDQVQQSAHTLFKGRVTLHEVLLTAAAAGGVAGRHDLKSEPGLREFLRAWDHSQAIRAEGASNVSIANILSNVLNKFALQGYLFTEQAWREICAVRPVNDFKPTKSINLLGDVMYRQFGPMGELQHASLGDQAFANQAAPYGRIVTIPWPNIVNDDLGILGTVPQKIGQGAGLALNDAIWTLWKNMAAGTVNGDDGVAFWRTTSSVTEAAKRGGTAYRPNRVNGAGGALSAASLQTVKALFDNQIDPNGNPLGFDGLKPSLLYGPSLWQTVMQLLYASGIVYGGASAALQPNYNAFQGYFNPVMSRYIENPNYVNTTTGWWMLFNPAALSTIEVAFLNGTDTPAVLQAGPDYQFDRLGISIRGTMPFGVTQQNFRGGVYAVGA